MLCVKCGNQLTDGAAFCPKCGTAASAPPMPEPAPQAAPQGVAKPKKRILPIVLIVVGAIVLLFVLLIIIGTSANKKADARLDSAWAHIEKNELVQAIEEANKVIEGGNGNIQKSGAYFLRAEAYRAGGNYDLAIADYTRSLEIDSTQSVSFNGRALCYYAAGDYVHALEDINKAISLDPNDASYQEGLRQIQQAAENAAAGSIDNSIANSYWSVYFEPVESEVALFEITLYKTRHSAIFVDRITGQNLLEGIWEQDGSNVTIFLREVGINDDGVLFKLTLVDAETMKGEVWEADEMGIQGDDNEGSVVLHKTGTFTVKEE